MGFQLKLGTLKQINPLGDRIVLVDAIGNIGDKSYTPSTINEGEYDEVENETGYGAPNPLRSERANYCIGIYRSSKADDEVTFEPYNPQTVTEFKAIADRDGWYRFNLISVPIKATVEEMVEGTTAYVTALGVIKKKTGTVYTTVTPASLRDTIYCSPTVEQLFVANNSKMFNLLNRQIIDLRKVDVNGRNSREISRVDDILRTVDGVLVGAIYEYVRGNKYNAQADIEFLNSNIDKYEQH